MSDTELLPKPKPEPALAMKKRGKGIDYETKTVMRKRSFAPTFNARS
jgi:hypothetical protein